MNKSLANSEILKETLQSINGIGMAAAGVIRVAMREDEDGLKSLSKTDRGKLITALNVEFKRDGYEIPKSVAVWNRRKGGTTR